MAICVGAICERVFGRIIGNGITLLHPGSRVRTIDAGSTGNGGGTLRVQKGETTQREMVNEFIFFLKKMLPRLWYRVPSMKKHEKKYTISTWCQPSPPPTAHEWHREERNITVKSKLTLVSLFKKIFTRKKSGSTGKMILSGRSSKDPAQPSLEESSWIDRNREIMRLSELVFEETEETNAALNRIAEIVSKAIEINGIERDLVNFCESVNFKQQLRLIVIQSLKFGHAITQITRTRFIVENSIDYIFDQNLKTLLKRTNIDYILSLSDLLAPENHDVKKYDPKTFEFFILNPRYTNDPYGLAATKPVLRSIDKESGVITAESKAAKRYVKPSFIITAPDGATNEERGQVKSEIDKMDDIEDLVMPAGFLAELIGMGKFQYKSEGLLDRTMQKIVTGLGVPPLALSIPEGTNKASAQYSLDLLHDKCIPIAEILLLQLNRIFADLFMIPKSFKLKKLSIFDIEMEAKSRMMDFEGISMLANGSTAEGLDPAAKKVLVKLITDYKTPEA